MQFQFELLKPSLQILVEALRVQSVLETNDEVVRVPDDCNVAIRGLLSPPSNPQIQRVVQIYVRKER